MRAALARTWRQSLFSYRALLGWLRPLDYAISMFLEPATQLLFFVTLGNYAGLPAEFYVIGNSVRLASMSALFGATSVILNERRQGTLQAVTATPTPLGQTFFGRSILQGLSGLLTVAFGFLLGALLFGLDFSAVSWPWLALTLVVTALAMAGLGLLIATATLLGTDANLALNLAFSALIVLSGANFPVDRLPTWARALARALPLTHGLEAVRSIFAGMARGVGRLLLLEAVIGLGYGVAGYWLFAAAERRARRTGSLELV